MSNVVADTTIYIGDIAFHEPVTVLTDYIITGMCIYFYMQLNRFPKHDIATKQWKYFFGLLGLSSFAGGCSHAFYAIHEGGGYKFFWLSMQVLNVFSVFCMQMAAYHSVLKHSSVKRYWKGSYMLELIAAMAAVLIFHNFLVVIINTAVALIPIMILHFINSKVIKANLWIAWGIVVLFATAFVNATKLTLHDYFNHLDLAHVLIMVNLVCMYTGVRRNASVSQFA